MKTKIFLLGLLAWCAIALTSCALIFSAMHDGTDPLAKVINEDFELWSMSREKVSLVKMDKETSGVGDGIIEKNFVAYDVKENVLILCEQIGEENQSFWTFDLKTEKLTGFNKYNELCSSIASEEFDWKPLWIEKFELIKE